ncbi:hypothetical protein [Bradyrhizobium sp. JR3.5]
MAEVTCFVALPFVAADGDCPGEPTECFNPNAAVMRAVALSRKDCHVGAVAINCLIDRELTRHRFLALKRAVHNS